MADYPPEAKYPPELDAIAQEHLRAASKAVCLAFEAGRREGEAKLRAELEGILNQRGRIAAPPTIIGKLKRAPMGSTRPAIIAALDLVGSAGSTSQQLFEHLQSAGHTLIKEKSVRTILHNMVKEGILRKQGSRGSIRFGKRGGDFP
jgi:hypothetical protein